MSSPPASLSMQDLIDKLEKASEGNRVFDGLIAEAVHPDCRIVPGANTLYIVHEGEKLAAEVPRFTTSIDAALTLVPEGWWLWHLGEVRTRADYVGKLHDPTGKWAAALQHVGGGRLQEGSGVTLPLALCVAALLSRAPDR